MKEFIHRNFNTNPFMCCCSCGFGYYNFGYNPFNLFSPLNSIGFYNPFNNWILSFKQNSIRSPFWTQNISSRNFSTYSYNRPNVNYVQTSPIFQNARFNNTKTTFVYNPNENGWINHGNTSTYTPSSSLSESRQNNPTSIKINKSSNGYGLEFLNRVKAIAKKINCDYKDLLAVMNAESGIDASNWHGRSAVGLIQFTDVALSEIKQTYGTSYTKQQVAKMSPLEQLDLVEKYLLRTKSYHFSQGARLSKEDLYAIVFMPGKADKEVLAQRGDGNYEGNEGLDFDKDGYITKTELGMQVDRKYVSDNSFLA